MLWKRSVRNILILFSATLCVAACKKEGSEDPVSTPVCKIITPADSTIVQKGTMLYVEASVSGLGSNTKVVFWVGTSQLIQVTGSPYEFTWNTAEWDTGIHVIRADAIGDKILVDDEVSIMLIDTIKPPQKPVPVFTVSPETGTTDTVFRFDASLSHDLEDDFEDLLFRWDFEGDGEWDTEYTAHWTIEHRYFHVGHFHPTLEVIDTDTMASDTSMSLVVTHSTSPDPCEGIISIPYGGKVYHTVPVGAQCWLKENLDIGRMIPSEQEQSNNQEIEKYCYNNDSTYCEKYGGLYMWKEAMKHVPVQGGRGICPVGFHIPADHEWKVLEGNADSQFGIGNPEWDETSFRGFDAGKHLKDQLGWYSGGNGNNIFGFRFKPGGYWEKGLNFGREGEEGHVWTSTHDSGQNALKRSMKYNSDGVSRSNHWDEAAFSVRCLKD